MPPLTATATPTSSEEIATRCRRSRATLTPRVAVVSSPTDTVEFAAARDQDQRTDQERESGNLVGAGWEALCRAAQGR